MHGTTSKSQLLLIIISLTILFCPGCQARKESPPPEKVPEKMPERLTVLMETEKGDIEVEIYPAKAPATCTNFLKYVDGGFYQGGQFHRTVKPDNQPDKEFKIEVIQAGINPDQQSRGFPPVKLERTNETGLKHLDGTISMARAEPETATSDFFICIGDQPELDYRGRRNPDGQGFAAFGKMIRGLNVVKQIQQAPAQGQRLTPQIRIRKISRKN